MQNWMKAFPEWLGRGRERSPPLGPCSLASSCDIFRYSSNRLFLVGESYAGLYVPMLAQQILEAGSMRLEGIAVGDGCLGGPVARHMAAAA